MKFFKKIFRKKKPELKPGAILDQVISQSSSSANQCLLYKLANYKRGGDLIDAIATGGQIAVEQLIREQFGVFMYNNGKGQVINRAEFLRWKYRDNHQVVIPIEASLSSHDPLGKWTDHKACWQMQYRGSLGESLLHVLIICDTKVHTKLARILLRVFPCLALDVMEGEEYLGASALHLSIAYSNNELVADLLEAGALINQRANGSFFLPRDQQRNQPSKTTDYEGLAYMGEYPLAWAACCANESVYNLLIDAGADPDEQDSFGNMILHMVVVCDKLDMFGYALRHPRTPARNGIANDQGLTPLTLACKLGRAEVFREMLELSAREFWRYSNITCSGYPLNALDTLLPDGRTNWNSALFIILNGTKEEHLDMLDGGIIQRLLEEKWKTFAQNQFLKRLLILFVHLFFLSLSVYLRPENNDTANAEREKLRGEENNYDIITIARYISELATLAGVLSFVIFQQGDEIKNQGFSAFVKQLGKDPAKAIFLISNLLILTCIPCRLMGDVETEEAILIFAVPGSWFLLMFFAGAIRLTGPFVTMIYSMITGDMFTFGIIYTIILFGFSQAFYFLFKGHPAGDSSLFNNYFTTWMALFQTTLGDYNYQELNQTSYPNLAKTVFVTFMIFVPILLLNMLIAMMGNTYSAVIERSEKEWMKQWAKIVVTLERAVPQADAQKYLEAYSIPLGMTDDGTEQRGVMVIKSKSKTRARQRKGAVNNWKRVGRVTLQALKKRGMTGEEMRRQMWGRASITSPTKVAKKKSTNPYNVYNETNSAVGAAMGVMTFTQDILISPDLPTEPVIPLDQKKKKKTTTVSTAKTVIKTDPTSTIAATTKTPALDDPLRELVLISETVPPDDETFITNVQKLAVQASTLSDAQDPSQVQTSAQLKQNLNVPKVTDPANIALPKAGQEITSFQEMFAAPTVDPEKERAFYKKLEALDDTEDSDGFIERPVLGKISLIRRAKSAVSKTSANRNFNDERFPLFNFAWEPQSQHSLANGIKNQGFIDNNSDEIIQIETEAIEDVENESKPPRNDDEPTVEEVRQKMAEFHLRRRPDLERVERKKREKSSKNRRYKNKISPDNTVDDDSKGRSSRHRSAPLKYTSQRSQRVCEDSPPDPLEPWSTRELQNINQILKSEKSEKSDY